MPRSITSRRIMSTNVWPVLITLICLWVCPVRICGFSWNISSSSAATGGDRAPIMMTELDGAVADFVMDGVDDPRGLKLLENARNKLAGPRNCWQEAYRKLFATCGEIIADKERQSRLAWHLSSCFQEDSGRPPFPSCGEGSRMVHCRKWLRESEDKVFLEFFLETNTLCRQLQAEAFKNSTERLINDLARSSKSAEEKLEVIEERSDQIIRESAEDTLSEQVLEESRDYEVLNYELLQTLVEKVPALAEKAGGRAQSSYGSEEESLRDYSWVFDDEVDSKMDPTIRPAAGAVASDPKAAQPCRPGGGDRREVHHDVGLPRVPQK